MKTPKLAQLKTREKIIREGRAIQSHEGLAFYTSLWISVSAKMKLHKDFWSLRISVPPECRETNGEFHSASLTYSVSFDLLVRPWAAAARVQRVSPQTTA